MAIPTTSLANWDRHNRHVQHELDGGEFLNAASTLIAAGPPQLRQTNARGSVVTFGQVNDIAYPVGVVESIGLAQNRQLQRLFEIGSKRSYFVNGRNIGQINLARTMFHGPSLMRAVYAYYPASKLNVLGLNVANLKPGEDPFSQEAPDIKSAPGYADFFINLDSDLFDQPFGLLFMLIDAEEDRYGAFYIENAYINGHQFSISATSTLIGEAISIQYDRLIPVNVQATPRKVVQADNVGLNTEYSLPPSNY